MKLPMPGLAVLYRREEKSRGVGGWGCRQDKIQLSQPEVMTAKEKLKSASLGLKYMKYCWVLISLSDLSEAEETLKTTNLYRKKAVRK